MYIPSITTILGIVFLIYIGNSMYQMTELFTVIKCTKEPCYTTFLLNKPRMQMALFISTARNPIPNEVSRVHKMSNFDYWNEYDEDFKIEVPLKTRRNGTLYMQVVLALAGEPLEWRTLRRDGPTVVHTLSLTEYMVPRAETFNLLGDGDARPQSKNSKANLQRGMHEDVSDKPLTHIRSQVYVNLLTDNVSLSNNDVPGEMAHLVHVNRYKQILPILKTDFFNTRLKDLVQLKKHNNEFTFTFHYRPMTTGKLRLMLMMEHAMNSLIFSGIGPKVIDEVKDLLSGANIYLLCCTFFISTIHLFFDFLSLKNDVSFWRKKRSYEGLSLRTTVWRAFSQIVIFLYLFDENTSQLVLIPAGLSTLIELWKCKKILRIELSFSGLMRKLTRADGEDKCASCVAEQRTEEFDKQGMRYLNYLLFPLCIGGATYSLLYQPHRSWYSWTINSLVNGVYAFGFLFMLPQLFVNYKLKSVAALPWRAFMYKAFNTFIDDFFAFIITMPTAHRVACLRDDIVFLIYLYQRWLYPVDKKRIDIGNTIEEHEVLQSQDQSVGNKQWKKKKRD